MDMKECKYLDNAATTPMLEEVIEEMRRMSGNYFNPSSTYRESSDLKNEISKVREDIGRLLNCSADNIIFTSGATEANNMVVKGFYFKRKSHYHIISSSIEHPSVFEPIHFLNKVYGIDSTLLTAKKGIVSCEDFKNSIQPDTAFASVMYVNNELGSIQPIPSLLLEAKKKDVFFHTDATQAVGKIPVDLKQTNVDALSFSGHKLFGPKGIGVLYLKEMEAIEPLLHGGGQEKGMRSGTENTLFILAMGIVVRKILEDQKRVSNHYCECKKHLVDGMNNSGIAFFLNDAEHSSDNIVSMGIRNVRGEALTGILDQKYNIKISNGSACSSNKEANLSYTLKEFGLSDKEIRETIRVSFGMETTHEDISCFVNAVMEIYSSYAN